MELTVEPLKVLIVDDEYLIRNLLRMRIDWEQQGMNIIGEASDAAEALEQVEPVAPGHRVHGHIHAKDGRY